MENLSRKIGFLKGLMEGLDIDTDSANGKLTAGIVDVLSDLTDRVEAMDELLEDLNDYVESIDDDLAELEGDRDEPDDDFLDDEEMDFDEDFGNGEDQLRLLDLDDEEMDFDEEFGDGEDQLHLLNPSKSEAADGEALAGNRCPKCSRIFFTAMDDDEDAEYLCPHCCERIRPVPLTPENAPIAQPVEE